MQDLKNKIAMVTGASSGIGEAIALELAQAGVRLALVGRNVARLERVAAEARPQSGEVHAYVADLAQAEDLAGLKASFEKDFVGLDMLVHCAGVLRLGRVADSPPALFEELFRINAIAPYALTRLFLPSLRRRCGDVVFMNSRVALGARPELVPYSATKAALKAVADGLRAELSHEPVRVISVYPGRVATPMQQYVHSERGHAYDAASWMAPREIAHVVVHALRMPAQFEVADVVVRGSNDSPS